MPTVTLTFVAPARRKSSAVAVVYGPTVDEPSADDVARQLLQVVRRILDGRGAHGNGREHEASDDPDGYRRTPAQH